MKGRSLTERSLSCKQALLGSTPRGGSTKLATLERLGRGGGEGWPCLDITFTALRSQQLYGPHAREDSAPGS